MEGAVGAQTPDIKKWCQFKYTQVVERQKVVWSVNVGPQFGQYRQPVCDVIALAEGPTSTRGKVNVLTVVVREYFCVRSPEVLDCQLGLGNLLVVDERKTNSPAIPRTLQAASNARRYNSVAPPEGKRLRHISKFAFVLKRFCLPVNAKGQRPRLRNPIVHESRPISSGDPLPGPSMPRTITVWTCS
ncbi:hypothetical protein J6590_058587 [Homalodisca vitripennis]|nr:hypothetical protein J6590_058587 [Homalodisca vitripennis]